MFLIDVILGVFTFIVLLGFVKGCFTIYQWYLDHKEFEKIIKEKTDKEIKIG
jgi:hypothetical protein